MKKSKNPRINTTAFNEILIFFFQQIVPFEIQPVCNSEYNTVLCEHGQLAYSMTVWKTSHLKFN